MSDKRALYRRVLIGFALVGFIAVDAYVRLGNPLRGLVVALGQPQVLCQKDFMVWGVDVTDADDLFMRTRQCRMAEAGTELTVDDFNGSIVRVREKGSLTWSYTNTDQLMTNAPKIARAVHWFRSW